MVLGAWGELVVELVHGVLIGTLGFLVRVLVLSLLVGENLWWSSPVPVQECWTVSSCC